MICIVDEDEAQLRPLKLELELLGYEVLILPNADEAFEFLVSKCDGIDLVIVDVMLSADENRSSSRYDIARTQDFLLTGLCLLDDLRQQNDALFPDRVVIYSMASNQKLVARIKESAAALSIAYYNKDEYKSALIFAECLDIYIKQLDGRISNG